MSTVFPHRHRSFLKTVAGIFPPPDFLSFTRMSVAVFPGKVRFIRLKRSGLGFELHSYGESSIPAIDVNSFNEKIKQETSEIISKLVKLAGSSSASVVISEKEVYLFPLTLPKMDLGEVASAIELRLEEYIPLPPADVIFTHKIVRESENGLYVTVSAAPRAVVEYATRSVFEAGVTPFKAETEGYALGQALVSRDDQKSHLIMAINETYTAFVIALGQVPVFSSTVPLGSRDFLGTIARAYQVSLDEAVKIREEQLFSATADESKFFPSAVGLLSSIKDEANKVINYWMGHVAKEGLPPIDKVLLVGSDACLPGVMRYFSASLKAPVAMGDVWKNLLSVEDRLPELSKRASLDYGATIGAAI